MEATRTAATPATDIRMKAYSFGRRYSLGEAYALLERPAIGEAKVAQEVFAAIRRNEFGVKAAWTDGLNGVKITVPVHPAYARR